MNSLFKCRKFGFRKRKVTIMKKIITLSLLWLFIAFACTSALAVAQENTDILKVSLKDAVDMALKASEDVQISDNEVTRSNSKHREEKSELYPHISGSTNWSSNYKYPDIPATAFTEDYDFNVGATLDQKLFTFGRISSVISAAQKQIEVSQWNKQTNEQKIIYITKLAYYNVHIAKRTLRIAQASYDRAQENKNILEQRSAGGRASKYDNIKIAADIASRSPSINNARANLNSAVHTLKRIIGVDPKTGIDITDDLSEEYQALDIEKLINELNNNQPILKALEKSIAANEYTIREKKAEYLPEISAFSTWNYKGSGNNYDIRSENLHDYGVVGLKVNLPIWEGGKRKEDLQQAKIDKRNAELSLDKTTKDLSLELYTAVGEYNEFIKTLMATKEAVRLAEESFKLSQDFFRSGQISVTDLNDAELLLTREKINKEKTLFNINATLAKIEKLAAMEAVSE